MAGKIILWILLALVALFAVLLLIPVKIRASYEDGAPSLRVRYGPVKLQLFPIEKQKEEKKPPKPKEKKEKPEKKKKPKAKINMDQILYALEKLPPILGRAMRRMGRSILVEPLKIHILVAGNDPADMALLYGRLEAAFSAGLPFLHKIMRIKEQDIRLFLDFTEIKMDFIADVGVVLRPGSLAWIGLRAGGSLLRWFLGFRKLASPTVEEDTRQKRSEAQDADDKEKSEHAAA